MRVLHIGDISGTSRNVIAVARQKGLDWVLRPVPAGRGANPALIAWQRLRDLLDTRNIRPRPDLLHINYGVSGYYGWFRKGVVLHLHGTDVRQDLHSRILGPIVKRSVRTADAVLYSTPDMAEPVLALRPDARWLPAPLSRESEVLLQPTRPRNGKRIFFASRWDDSKGAPELLELARKLKEIRPELELLGLQWGTRASEASAAGIRLLPHMSHDSFRQQLADADLVIGQISFGVLGLSDLEAMAQARPVLARFTADDAYGSAAPIANTAEADALGLVEDLLDNPSKAAALGEAARSWALQHHSAQALELQLEALYAQILGTHSEG